MKERIEWLDSVKAVGIFLMVLCHAKLSNTTIVTVISTFHMPLFFILSGYLDRKQEISMAVTKKYFRSLITPYFFFSICSFSICWISPILHPEIYHMESYAKIFLSALIGMFLMEDKVTSFSFLPSGPLWFLIALFQVKLLFSIGVLLYRKNCMWTIPFSCFLIITYNCRIPFFSVESALLAFPFYCVGFFLQELHVLDKFPPKRYCNVLIGMALLAYIVLFGVKNGRVDIDGCLYGNNIVFFYLNGTIGTIMIILLIKETKKLSILSECGKSTITILGTHFFFLIPSQILFVTIFHFSISDLPFFCSALMAIVACLGGVLIHSFLNRHFPLLIGKNDTKKTDNIYTSL